MKVPPHTEAFRRIACPKCSADYTDPCARCPDGLWDVHLFCATAKPNPTFRVRFVNKNCTTCKPVVIQGIKL